MNTPENFPTISMDIELGKHASFIAPNLQYITDKLSEGGLSDDEINATSIHFSAQHNIAKKPRKGYTKQGTYNRKERLVTVARPKDLEPDSWPPDSSLTRLLYAGAECSDTLEHELEHAVATKDSEHMEKEKSYQKRLLGKRMLRSYPTIGIIVSGFALENAAHIDNAYVTSLALAIGVISLKKTVFRKKIAQLEHNEYLNAPDEKRARLAGENAPNIVAFIPKDIKVKHEDSRLIIKIKPEELTQAAE